MKHLLWLTLLVSSFVVAQQVDTRDPDVRAVFKMSPKDVMRMRGAANEHEKAVYTEIRNPKELSDEVELTLSPGEATQVVSILQRAPTTISFVDATGTPWPIKRVEAYDGELFGAKAVDNSFKNSVILHGVLPAGASYLTVFLLELPTPITVKVVVAQNAYHKSKTVKVMKIGPETELNPITLGAAQEIGLAADVDLNNILFGVTPFESRKIASDNAEVLVWEKGDHVLVRTSMVIFSPAHIRIKPGTNGYTAYRLPKTTRLYASNEAGKVVRISLKDK